MTSNPHVSDPITDAILLEMPERNTNVKPVARASVIRKWPVRKALSLLGRCMNVASMLAHAIVPSISPVVIGFFL